MLLAISLLDAPPYSSDLAPCDFWLFPKIKANMHGKCYEDHEGVIKAVNEVR